MTDELKQIAYNEGCEAYFEDGINLVDNPYDGVSLALANYWDQGYWDMFYDDV
jgi:hypothetical protein